MNAWNGVKAIDMLAYMQVLFSENKIAAPYFEAFSKYAKRAMLEWILDARRPETRQKRIKRNHITCWKKWGEYAWRHYCKKWVQTGEKRFICTINKVHVFHCALIFKKAGYYTFIRSSIMKKLELKKGTTITLAFTHDSSQRQFSVPEEWTAVI